MGQRGLATQRNGPRLIAAKKGQTNEESGPSYTLILTHGDPGSW